MLKPTQEEYDRANFDYAAWERAKLYPYQNIVWSVRRRPWYGRITGLGWFTIFVFALAVLAFLWDGR